MDKLIINYNCPFCGEPTNGEMDIILKNKNYVSLNEKVIECLHCNRIFKLDFKIKLHYSLSNCVEVMVTRAPKIAVNQATLNKLTKNFDCSQFAGTNISGNVFVYILKLPNDTIKIGVSEEPKLRLSQYITILGEFKILCIFSNANRYFEKLLHSICYKSRIGNSEVFYLQEDVVKLLKIFNIKENQ